MRSVQRIDGLTDDQESAVLDAYTRVLAIPVLNASQSKDNSRDGNT